MNVVVLLVFIVINIAEADQATWIDYSNINDVSDVAITGNTIWSDGETYLAPPVAAFNANVTSICTGESVSFTNNSINATNYSWTFYGGMPNFSNEPNPVVTYLDPGTYNVQLSVSGTSGSDELILENYIHVIAPKSNFDADLKKAVKLSYVKHKSTWLQFNPEQITNLEKEFDVILPMEQGTEIAEEFKVEIVSNTMVGRNKKN